MIFLTNFNPIKMINYRRLCRVTSSPYSHNLLHQTASYVNFNLCYLLAAFLLVNFVSSRFARFGGLFRHSWFCFRRNKFSLRISSDSHRRWYCCWRTGFYCGQPLYSIILFHWLLLWDYSRTNTMASSGDAGARPKEYSLRSRSLIDYRKMNEGKLYALSPENSEEELNYEDCGLQIIFPGGTLTSVMNSLFWSWLLNLIW